MMADEGSEGHDSTIYPTAPGHAVPEPIPLRDFAPWHLPRKQWVRQTQWARCTGRLLQTLRLTDRPLRYLGLPGTELLDLEVLASLCAEKKASFRYLGFNTGAQTPGQLTTQRLSEDLLKTMEGVDGRSIVCTDDILALASKTSIAFSRLKGYKSFDVVNLDLCDVFTTIKSRPVHLAVKNLIEYQVNRRTQPWLLFVTTAADRDAVAAEDVQQYRVHFDENHGKWEEFRQAARDLISDPAASLGDSTNEVHPFERQSGTFDFGKLLTVSIGKWLASLLKQPAPWRVELKSCVCYRRGLKGIDTAAPPVPEPEMFSLVFGIRRPDQPLSDPLNIAVDPKPSPAIDWEQAEREMAAQIAKKAGKALDLDLHLQGKPEEYKSMTEEAAILLGFRNYDVEQYRRFARDVPVLQG